MIHTVKGFSIVNEVEVDVFLEFSSFFYIQQMLAIWSLVSLPFLNPACTSGSSQSTYSWSLAWRTLSITFNSSPLCVVCHINCVHLFATPWIIAHQTPLSMEFSRQKYWSGLPFSSPGDLPDQGIKPAFPASAGGFFTTPPHTF